MFFKRAFNDGDVFSVTSSIRHSFQVHRHRCYCRWQPPYDSNLDCDLVASKTHSGNI